VQPPPQQPPVRSSARVIFKKEQITSGHVIFHMEMYQLKTAAEAKNFKRGARCSLFVTVNLFWPIFLRNSHDETSKLVSYFFCEKGVKLQLLRMLFLSPVQSQGAKMCC
jgi:hypothetical protein